MTHICVSKLTIIGSDNGLSPGRRQAIIWTNAGILLIGPLGTNFSEISITILAFSFTKMRLKVSSGKWRPFCLGLNVLTWWWTCLLIIVTEQLTVDLNVFLKLLNHLPPGQNGHHSDRWHFQMHFLEWKWYDWILIQISLKFVPMSPIDNKPALVQVMAWRLTGDKPLLEPMLTQFTDGYMWH